jgi:hypothetical protein
MIPHAPDTAIPLQQAKLWLMEHTFLARDALHIYVALILFFGTMLIFRWRLGDWRPWLVVLAAALTGEIWDIIDAIVYQQPIAWGGSWKDIWNTLFWPTAIQLLARHTRMFRAA